VLHFFFSKHNADVNTHDAFRKMNHLTIHVKSSITWKHHHNKNQTITCMNSYLPASQRLTPTFWNINSISWKKILIGF